MSPFALATVRRVWIAQSALGLLPDVVRSILLSRQEEPAMSDPTKTPRPRKAADTPPAATAKAPAPAAPAAAPAPAAPAPQPAPAAAAPAAAAPAPAAPAAPAGPSVMDALSASVRRLVQRLDQSELLLLVGALIIVVGPWFFFSVLLRDYPFVPDLALLGSFGVLAIIGLHHSGRHAFGESYRTWLAALGGLVAAVAAIYLINSLRATASNVNTGSWLSQILFWVGAAAQGVGAWMIWKKRT